MLLSLVIAALIHRIVSPDLFSLTMLEIVLPLTFVSCAVLVNIHTVAVGLVVEPLALEDIAIDVPELALAARLIEAPVALILGAVLPDLHTIAVLQVAEPLAHVSRAIFEMNFWSLFELRLIYFPHVELLVELTVQHIVPAHVVVVLRVELAQLGSDSLARHHATSPCLQADYQVNVFLEMHLQKADSD